MNATGTKNKCYLIPAFSLNCLNNFFLLGWRKMLSTFWSRFFRTLPSPSGSWGVLACSAAPSFWASHATSSMEEILIRSSTWGPAGILASRASTGPAGSALQPSAVHSWQTQVSHTQEDEILFFRSTRIILTLEKIIYLAFSSGATYRSFEVITT